jgi:hypothetical protein
MSEVRNITYYIRTWGYSSVFHRFTWIAKYKYSAPDLQLKWHFLGMKQVFQFQYANGIFVATMICSFCYQLEAGGILNIYN